MSNYTPETVEPLIADLLGNLEEALMLAKSATDEVAALKAAAATAASVKPVVLEKVASIPDEDISASLSTLVDNGFLDSKDVAGVASAIKADPSVALKVASRIAILSAAPTSQGAGIAKSASAQEEASSIDPDGWSDCINESQR